MRQTNLCKIKNFRVNIKRFKKTSNFSAKLAQCPAPQTCKKSGTWEPSSRTFLEYNPDILRNKLEIVLCFCEKTGSNECQFLFFT